MSIENAHRFLEAVASDETLREKFEQASSPEEFNQVAQQLGYSFSNEELMTLAHQLSEGVELRRMTGVWKWLRRINWVPPRVYNTVDSSFP